MDFKTASNVVMPFGEYAGQTLDRIAESDAGLKYLDWLYGETSHPIKAALKTYLADPTIAKAVNDLIH